MSQHTIGAAVSILLAIIGVAIIAVLVSNSAQTGNVLSAGGSSLAQMIRCAISPVMGGRGSCGESVSSSISFGGIK